MKHISLFLVVVLIALLTACSGMYHTPSTYNSSGQSHSKQIEHSLFDSNEQTISEANIQKLLDGHIVIEDSIRLAVFNNSIYSNIENHVLWAWSESLGCAIK